MEVRSAATPAKRARAKVKDEVAEPKIIVKKSRKVVRKPQTEVAPPAVTPSMVQEDLEGKIAMTAYFLAAERNFMPGHELDDWLEAERRVRTHSSKQ